MRNIELLLGGILFIVVDCNIYLGIMDSILRIFYNVHMADLEGWDDEKVIVALVGHTVTVVLV